LNIHVPFFIAAGALLAGIVVLSTAHCLLGHAEQVQAEQAAAAAQPDLAEEALAVAEGSET
jgi:ACDE family multidrug resistance protein